MATTSPELRHLIDQVQQAGAAQTPLAIHGNGSKQALCNPVTATPLPVADYQGIISYEPTELVIQACAGTPIAEIEAALAEQNQMLGPEPPHFGQAATLGGTLGGTLAMGISGPRRPFSGSMRDHILGVRAINGLGQDLNFGGQVIKNVAGFDVSRLLVGSQGTLAVITEASLRVFPKPRAEQSLMLNCNAAQALKQLAAWLQTPLPISAAAHVDQQLWLRLSGAEASVRQASQTLGGEVVATEPAQTFWHKLREQQLPWFEPQKRALWRISIEANAPLAELGDWLLDWAGHQRWLLTDRPAEQIRDYARQHHGHASLWRTSDNNDSTMSRWQPLSGEPLALHKRIKHAFDPHGILNPGRLYPDL